MSRRPARCTEADIRRATKVAKEMGMTVNILPDGTIRIETTGKLTPVDTQDPPVVEVPRYVL